MKFETVSHPFMLLMTLCPKLPLLNIRTGNTRNDEKILAWIYAQCMIFGKMDPALCLGAFNFWVWSSMSKPTIPGKPCQVKLGSILTSLVSNTTIEINHKKLHEINDCDGYSNTGKTKIISKTDGIYFLSYETTPRERKTQ
jgi:hypothetical protein